LIAVVSGPTGRMENLALDKGAGVVSEAKVSELISSVRFGADPDGVPKGSEDVELALTGAVVAGTVTGSSASSSSLSSESQPKSRARKSSITSSPLRA
jgi:hypothetical protein